ncbi:MAG: DUF86 domain-containing protein [candidate division NC10 bacterium]|nr:DUF86 domain-containing protein [candidate division NC10 bacterium]
MRREFCAFPKDFRLEEILQNQGNLERLFSQERVIAAYLFGSLLEGFSVADADIAVLFEKYSFSDYERLYEALCRLFKADNIDLLPLNRAPFPLKRRILLGGLPLYEATPEITLQFKEQVLAEQEDHYYLARMVGAELKKRIKGGLDMLSLRLDRERVEAYLSKLGEVGGELARKRKDFSSFEEFMNKQDQRELCVHYLRIALECVLDICRHFVAVKGVSLMEIDTTNLIELAGEKGLIPPEFAKKIRGMAGMRNAIVHVYWKLDYGAIFEMVTERLKDFQEFSQFVFAYLDRESAITE